MLVVGEADDAGQAVRRPARVERLVLLEAQHAPATTGQVIRGAEPIPPRPMTMTSYVRGT